jgi:hypothetical protein
MCVAGLATLTSVRLLQRGLSFAVSQLNTVQAVWKMAKQDVTEEMYTGFYKFKSKS